MSRGGLIRSVPHIVLGLLLACGPAWGGRQFTADDSFSERAVESKAHAFVQRQSRAECGEYTALGCRECVTSRWMGPECAWVSEVDVLNPFRNVTTDSSRYGYKAAFQKGAGQCMIVDSSKWGSKYVALREGVSQAFMEESRATGADPDASCLAYRQLIESDYNNLDNEGPNMRRERESREAEEAERVRVQRLRRNSFEMASRVSAPVLSLQDAARICDSGVNEDPDFFHKVHRVAVDDLEKYALLDAEFDDHHVRGRTDQQIIDSLKSYDPFEWSSQGQKDPIMAYFSTDDFDRFLIFAIESGRHRSAAAMQSGKKFVPVRIECKCPCATRTHVATNSPGPTVFKHELLSATEQRRWMKKTRPHNFVPLGCDGRAGNVGAKSC